MSKIKYEISQEEAKDILDYMKDALEMYYPIDKNIFQKCKILKEKLQIQYEEQSPQSLLVKGKVTAIF